MRLHSERKLPLPHWWLKVMGHGQFRAGTEELVCAVIWERNPLGVSRAALSQPRHGEAFVAPTESLAASQATRELSQRFITGNCAWRMGVQRVCGLQILRSCALTLFSYRCYPKSFSRRLQVLRGGERGLLPAPERCRGALLQGKDLTCKWF